LTANKLTELKLSLSDQQTLLNKKADTPTEASKIGASCSSYKVTSEGDRSINCNTSSVNFHTFCNPDKTSQGHHVILIFVR